MEHVIYAITQLKTILRLSLRSILFKLCRVSRALQPLRGVKQEGADGLGFFTYTSKPKENASISDRDF